MAGLQFSRRRLPATFPGFLFAFVLIVFPIFVLAVFSVVVFSILVLVVSFLFTCKAFLVFGQDFGRARVDKDLGYDTIGDGSHLAILANGFQPRA